MKRLNLIILLIFALTVKLNAQNMVRLCVGGNHNFGVPSTVGSIYNWQVQNTTIATITSGNGTEQIAIDLNNPGLFQLLVEEVDVNGCSGYDSVLVEVLPLPTPNIFAYGPISFCEGDSVRLQVDSIYASSIWNTGSVASSIFVDSTGEYYIGVTDTNGCVGISPSIFTQQHSNPDIDFSINGICENLLTVFTDLSTISSGAISDRVWYLGDGTSASGDIVNHVYQNDGDYVIKLVVVSDFGCLDSLNKLISIFKQTIVDFSYTPYTISTLNPEISFSNISINTIHSLWSFGDSTFSTMENPTHIYDDPGIYNVMLTVTDSNQCIDSISKQIIMYYDFVLHIPTAFTPNGDGNNDAFGPTGLRMSKYKSYEFYIYNRWGERIFETDDINELWDGVDSPMDVYNWILIITDELGEIRKENGLVTLIK